MAREIAAEIETTQPTNLEFLPPCDPVMRELFARIDTLASRSSYARVLILGETGVGKEILARRIHQTSSRRQGPFVVANCAATAEALFEREFFGHKKGAFTGAIADEPGYFEMAHGGTLFLDELGDLPLIMQAKLLRIIEDGQVKRLGGSVVRTVDVRIIAATNRNLERDILNGSFRLDLFHRLNSVEIHVPPLRERRADIPTLAEYLLTAQCSKHGFPAPRLSHETIDYLLAYPYPGNVRELGQALLSAALQCPGDEIRPEDLPRRILQGRHGLVGKSNSQPSAKAAEYERIRRALEQTAGNQTRAAALLGMPLRTFVSRLKSHGIPGPKQRSAHERRPHH